MELWVRSQDRECLVKTNRIDIDTNGRTILVNGFETIVGTYKSKERALEVLDEIQNILKPKYILDSSSIKPDGDSWVENGLILQKYNANARVEGISTYVYEMPKE